MSMMKTTFLFVVGLVTITMRTDAHMSLVIPPSRNAVDRALPQWHGGKWYPYEENCTNPGPKTPANPSGCKPAGTDGWGCNCFNGTGNLCDVAQSCFWFSQGCTIGCKTCDGGPSNPNTVDRCNSGMNATVNDPMHRTFNRNATAGSPQDIYKHNPWRAPGSAPVYDPCGMAGGGPHQQPGEAKYTATKFAQQGDNGTQVLPAAPSGTVWKAGETVRAKWSIRANHGGGYQYRLCPTFERLTEECFQKYPLDFASDHHVLELVDGTNLEIPATFVKDGVLPIGSTWAMNPLPYSNPESVPEFNPPCNETVNRKTSDTGRCSGRDPFNSLISDLLTVPNALPAGDYVLGIRWDCEKSAQIWQNCADVSISN